MASASAPNDPCAYAEKLRRTTGPGMYALTRPGNDVGGPACGRDVPADPYLRYQAWGPGACPPGRSVDDGSELEGLNYKLSRCSGDAYLPGKYPRKGACGAAGAAAARACMAPTEDTRLSNPPCTLRATGINRWEWLCWNPQDRALVPFEWNTSYRTVVKDNFVPCLPVPLDQTAALPHAGNAALAPTFAVPKGLPPNLMDPTPTTCAQVRKL